MTTREALEYDTPSIAEYVSNDFLQGLIAKYVAHKVGRKLARLARRRERVKWAKDLLNPNRE